jgi:uncharacterized protein (TIGR03437 family)
MQRRWAPFALAFFLPVLGAQSNWKLVWSDEFSGPANTPPDSSKWVYDLGAGGWGNNELQAYTNSTDNAYLDGNGNLVIRALRSPTGYTSARLKTLGKLAVKYGRIEARIKVPFGQGIWPAFWMLGNDFPTASWPASGEIDIMENIGREPATVHATIHGPGYSGGSGLSGAYTLPGGQRFADAFHTFAVTWTADSIEFFVDSISYHKVSPASLAAGREWVFRKPFFLLLNVAVGGIWPGNPDATTTFPQSMTVDYVRVYGEPPAVNANGVLNAASYAPVLAPGSLASVFGEGLSDSVAADLFEAARDMFRPSGSGASVTVNGLPCPLTYVSPEQINIQIPWEAPVGRPVPIQVVRNGVSGNPVDITLSAAAPAAFGVSGVAILTCAGGLPKGGVPCTLWGNGFGPTSPPQQTGVPSRAAPLPHTVNACRLTAGGVEAAVLYCGAAPTLIIHQLNFTYPEGIPVSGEAIEAALTIAGASGPIKLPRPQ